MQEPSRQRSGGVQAVVGTRRGESYRCIGDPEVPDSLNTEMVVAYCPLVLGASHPDGPKTRHEEAIRNTPDIGPGVGIQGDYPYVGVLRSLHVDVGWYIVPTYLVM